MNIFISYTVKDRSICDALIFALKKEGHSIFNYSINNFNIGKSIIEILKKELSTVDLFIAIITENYINSSYAQAELSSVIFGSYDIPILPVLVGDVFVPDFLKEKIFIRVNNSNQIVDAVLDAIVHLNNNNNGKAIGFSDKESTIFKCNELDEKVNVLKKALIDNQLTLVCGAGVSMDSFIPSWNELLIDILTELFGTPSHNSFETKQLTKDLVTLMPQSNLIL